MIKAVLFDLVGTLIEESSRILSTEQGYYELQVKAIHQSLEKDDILVDWSSFKDRYGQIRNEQRERARKTLREYDLCERVSDTIRFFNYDAPPASNVIRRAVDAYMKLFIDSLRIHSSTYDVLKALAAEYRLGLVTNFAYSPGAYRILDQFSLRPFFRAIVISREVGWMKPSKHIFDFALSQRSIKPEEAIFIGDDYEADILGANNVGMKTIYLCKNPVNRDKADMVIECLTTLPSAIKQLSHRLSP